MKIPHFINIYIISIYFAFVQCNGCDTKSPKISKIPNPVDPPDDPKNPDKPSEPQEGGTSSDRRGGDDEVSPENKERIRLDRENEKQEDERYMETQPKVSDQPQFFQDTFTNFKSDFNNLFDNWLKFDKNFSDKDILKHKNDRKNIVNQLINDIFTKLQSKDKTITLPQVKEQIANILFSKFMYQIRLLNLTLEKDKTPKFEDPSYWIRRFKDITLTFEDVLLNDPTDEDIEYFKMNYGLSSLSTQSIKNSVSKFHKQSSTIAKPYDKESQYLSNCFLNQKHVHNERIVDVEILVRKLSGFSFVQSCKSCNEINYDIQEFYDLCCIFPPIICDDKNNYYIFNKEEFKEFLTKVRNFRSGNNECGFQL